MKQEIIIAPFHMRRDRKNIVIKYYMIFDENTRREVTITGPSKNFNEGLNLQRKLKDIFLIIFKKSGWSDMVKDGKIYMSYSDFMNMEFSHFRKISIENVLM